MAFKTDYDFDAEKIAYRLRHKSAEDVASDHRRQVRVAAEDRLRRIQEQECGEDVSLFLTEFSVAELESLLSIEKDSEFEERFYALLRPFFAAMSDEEMEDFCA